MSFDHFAKPAASLIIWSSKNARVFMIKRQRQTSFFPNAHVFPGGAVEDIDREWAQKQNVALAEKASDFLEHPYPAEALALFFAAIRETAEESGLLYAIDTFGHLPHPTSVRTVLDEIDAGGSFYQALQNHNLIPDVMSLIPVSWWITPEIEKHRYDTRFFLAKRPGQQIVRLNKNEALSGNFIGPRQILKAYLDNKVILAPPTLAILEMLFLMRYFEDYETIFTKPNYPICPKAHLNENGQFLLALPGDPLYCELKGAVLMRRTRFEMNSNGRFI